MIKKLRKQNGESLIEVMVALLIAVLSMGMVATAAIAAAKINANTRAADIAFAEELQKAELYASITVDSKTLTIDFGEGNVIEETVSVYGDGSKFASYRH